MDNALYKSLSRTEAEQFVAWATENYVPGTDVGETWHPIARMTCELMNAVAVQAEGMPTFVASAGKTAERLMEIVLTSITPNPNPNPPRHVRRAPRPDSRLV